LLSFPAYTRTGRAPPRPARPSPLFSMLVKESANATTSHTGQIVAAGAAGEGGFALARHKPDGTPDSILGSGSRVSMRTSVFPSVGAQGGVDLPG
jgi:hypothetical protein